MLIGYQINTNNKVSSWQKISFGDALEGYSKVSSNLGDQLFIE